MKIDRIDHFVLTVKNLEATCEFYSQVLGMEVVTFNQGRVALKFGNQKFNLHEVGREIEPRAIKPTPGSADFCLITEDSLLSVIDRLKTCGIEIIEKLVSRNGAIGKIRSIYIRDPDGNLVEISSYEQEDNKL
ncbi:MAG: VOC family protein [Pleurocapsa sp.]